MKVFTFYLCIVLTFCDANNAFNKSLQRSKRSNGARCALPSRADEDKTYIVNCKEDYFAYNNEEDGVPDGTTLQFICNPGYVYYMDNKNFNSVCMAGSWVPPIYPCLRTCAALKSAPDVKCYHNNQEIECGGEYLMGTKLRASCSAQYYHPNHEKIVCNGDGKWSVENIKCVPDCGNYSEEAKNLYGNTKYLPWHVLVATPASKSLSSGTLIASNLVICDATRVVNEYGDPWLAKDVKIIVDSIFVDSLKIYKVKHVFFPPQGFNFEEKPEDRFNNLAILYLTEKVKISATVMPVCVNRDGLHLPFDLSSVTGEVVMTRATLDKGTISLSEIDLVKVQIRNYRLCVLRTGDLLHYDQFCGIIQGLEELDDHDSGSGHYIKNRQDNLYYITGVYAYQYRHKAWRLFTNLATHMEWINTIYEGIDAIDDKDVVKYEGCGEYPLLAAAFQYNSKYYPWHVRVQITGLKESHISSGTLIASNLVLTDAINKIFVNGDRVPMNNIKVIVNGFFNEEDQTTHEVKEIYSPLQIFSNEIPEQVEQLRGDDIAVLHLAKHVTISSIVHPVCVDWTGANLPTTFITLTNKIVSIGDRKTVGSNDGGVYTIDTLSYHPEWYRRILAGHQQIHLLHDQFCAKSEDTEVLGGGDLGGGYYVRGLKDNLFYIKGIYIENIMGILVYTDLATHIEWLNAVNKKVNGKDERYPEPSSPPSNHSSGKLSQFGCDDDPKISILRAENRGCNLPKKTDDHIDFDIICPDEFRHKCSDRYIQWVVEETKLQYWCDPKNEYGFYSQDSIMNSTCAQNTWLPPILPCRKKCRKIFFENIKLSCIHDGVSVPCDRDNILDGTTVTLSCQPGLIPTDEYMLNATFHCRHGEWGAQQWVEEKWSDPKCVPRICFHKTYSFTGLTYESN